MWSYWHTVQPLWTWNMPLAKDKSCPLRSAQTPFHCYHILLNLVFIVVGHLCQTGTFNPLTLCTLLETFSTWWHSTGWLVVLGYHVIHLSTVNRPFFVPNCWCLFTHWLIVDFGSRFAHFCMYYSIRPNAYNMLKGFKIFSIPTRSTYDAAAAVFGHWLTIPMPQSFVQPGF